MLLLVCLAGSISSWWQRWFTCACRIFSVHLTRIHFHSLSIAGINIFIASKDCKASCKHCRLPCYSLYMYIRVLAFAESLASLKRFWDFSQLCMQKIFVYSTDYSPTHTSASFCFHLFMPSLRLLLSFALYLLVVLLSPCSRSCACVWLVCLPDNCVVVFATFCDLWFYCWNVVSCRVTCRPAVSSFTKVPIAMNRRAYVCMCLRRRRVHKVVIYGQNSASAAALLNCLLGDERLGVGRSASCFHMIYTVRLGSEARGPAKALTHLAQCQVDTLALRDFGNFDDGRSGCGSRVRGNPLQRQNSTQLGICAGPAEKVRWL